MDTSTLTPPEGLRIVRFEAENFKRLRAVEIVPDGDVVVVAGRNAQGKSSVLDAIMAALAGAAGAKQISRPIRDGESRAEVTVDLGELVVTRTWEPDKPSKLVVRNAAGQPIRSPQSILDALLGKLSFDPAAFARMSAKDQRAALLDVVDLPFDPDELEAERQALYDERTIVNREVRQVEARMEATPPPDPDVPDVEVSLSDLLAEERRAQAAHNAHAAARDNLGAAIEERDAAEDRVAELERQLAAARQELDRARRGVDDATRAAHDAGRDLPDLQAIADRMESAESTNAAVRDARSYRALWEHAVEQRQASQVLTARMVELDDRKAAALAAATMPVPGLSFDADGITYNGVPFSQASQAEQLRVSLGMAMALNPTLRVIRITDGSLLDGDSRAIVRDMAADRGYQVWLEVVDESGAVGVVIEDGMVKL